MGIISLGNHRYKIIVRLRNKKKELTLEGVEHIDAEEAEVKLKRSILEELGECKYRGPTFHDAIECYREFGPRKTLLGHASFLKYLDEHLGNNRLTVDQNGCSEIWSGLQNLVNKMKTSGILRRRIPKTATINLIVALASAAITKMIKTKKNLQINPIAKFPVDPPRNNEFRIINALEIVQLFKNLLLELHPLIALALAIPIRGVDLVNMKKSSYMPVQKALHFFEIKTGTERYIKIPAFMLPYFENLQSVDTDFVFYHFSKSGSCIPWGRFDSKKKHYVPSFKILWNRACLMVGITKFNFHKTRQLSAQNLLFQGYTAEQCRYYGGWKSESSFNRYVRPDLVLNMREQGILPDLSWQKTILIPYYSHYKLNQAA